MAKPTIDDAIELALKAHRGQKDKYEQAYILHPLRLMVKMSSDDERMVAALHDVVEDSGTTLDDLRQLGYSPEVVAGVEAMTKREGEAYMDAIKRAKANPLARRVKLADLEDNMDVRRMDKVGDNERERLAKYLKAWQFILESE
jgi:(p)ppGpp synthase/HD superfamily hydrolase